MMYDDLQPQFDVLKKQIEILTITLTQKVMEPQIYHEYQSNRVGYPDSRAYQNQEQHNMYLYLPPYYNLPYPPAQPGSPYIAPYYLSPLAYGQSLPYPPLQPAPVQDTTLWDQCNVWVYLSGKNTAVSHHTLQFITDHPSLCYQTYNSLKIMKTSSVHNLDQESGFHLPQLQ